MCCYNRMNIGNACIYHTVRLLLWCYDGGGGMEGTGPARERTRGERDLPTGREHRARMWYVIGPNPGVAWTHARAVAVKWRLASLPVLELDIA